MLHIIMFLICQMTTKASNGIFYDLRKYAYWDFLPKPEEWLLTGNQNVNFDKNETYVRKYCRSKYSSTLHLNINCKCKLLVRNNRIFPQCTHFVNEVWGKVMFLHLSVSHFVCRGVLCMMSLPVWLPSPMFLLEGSLSRRSLSRGSMFRGLYLGANFILAVSSTRPMKSATLKYYLIFILYWSIILYLISHLLIRCK